MTWTRVSAIVVIRSGREGEAEGTILVEAFPSDAVLEAYVIPGVLGFAFASMSL